MLKPTDLRKKTDQQLEAHAQELADKLAALPKQRMTQESSNVKQQFALKKERARTLTILNEKRNNPSDDDKENA